MSARTSDKLSALLEGIAKKGIVRVEDHAADALKDAAERAGLFLEEHETDPEIRDLALEAVAKVEAAAPRLVKTTGAELRELLLTGWNTLEAGYPEGVRELEYQARRELKRAITAGEVAAQRAHLDRLQFLAEVLEDLGAIAIKLLPLLIAAL